MSQDFNSIFSKIEWQYQCSSKKKAEEAFTKALLEGLFSNYLAWELGIKSVPSFTAPWKENPDSTLRPTNRRKFGGYVSQLMRHQSRQNLIRCYSQVVLRLDYSENKEEIDNQFISWESAFQESLLPKV